MTAGADLPPTAVSPRHSPGRNDPCWCGSGRKYKRCCASIAAPHWTPRAGVTEVHEGARWEAELDELEQARGAAVDVDVDELAPDEDAAVERPRAPRTERWVPEDLEARLEAHSHGGFSRIYARLVHQRLNGRAPATLSDEERQELRDELGRPGEVDAALALLEKISYGQPPPRRSRSQRRHGLRRDQRLVGLVGLLPRCMSQCCPTSSDSHREGRNDGEGIWATVTMSGTYRPDHLGLQAFLGAIWRRRSPAGDYHAYLTAGEGVHVLTGRGVQGGRDTLWLHQLLDDLATIELRAEPKPGVDEAYAIPSRPVEYVERRLGDSWVRAEDYAAAVEQLSDDERLEAARDDQQGPGTDVRPTLRVRLADWVIEELRHDTRRPTFIDFDVWAHLRPSARRVYAFVQGRARDKHDGRVRFYLAAPCRFVLGVGFNRHRRGVAIVRNALSSLRDADRRYTGGYGQGWRTNTHERVWEFSVRVTDGPQGHAVPSMPTRDALATKCAPRRPLALRPGLLLRRRMRVLRASELADGRTGEMSVETARLIQESLAESIEDAHRRAQRALADDPRRRRRIQDRDRRAGPAPPGA